MKHKTIIASLLMQISILSAWGQQPPTAPHQQWISSVAIKPRDMIPSISLPTSVYDNLYNAIPLNYNVAWIGGPSAMLSAGKPSGSQGNIYYSVSIIDCASGLTQLGLSAPPGSYEVVFTWEYRSGNAATAVSPKKL